MLLKMLITIEGEKSLKQNAFYEQIMQAFIFAIINSEIKSSNKQN